jgi:putative membrane protein
MYETLINESSAPLFVREEKAITETSKVKRMKRKNSHSALPHKQSNRNPWKGLVAGVVGGVVASWTMDRFQYWWLSFGGADELQLQQAPSAEGNQEEPATVKTASAISEAVLRHSLTVKEKEIAGALVHYAVGTTAGAVYGVAAEYEPDVTNLAGIPFGAAFWMVVDEGALPLLGLAKGPTAYPISTHAYALASHLVFGLTAEVVRSTVRRAL